jgi:histidinol-phosphatase (PHP family)
MIYFAEAASKAGVDAICFTDHVDFSPIVKWRDYYDYESAIRELEFTREHAPPDVRVFGGFEIDFQTKFEREAKEFLNGKQPDFVIGSVHYVADELVMINEYFDGKDEIEAYENYFDEVQHAAQSGLFDVIGHLDYPKRAGGTVHGKFPFAKFEKKIETILKTAMLTGTGIEVNTSGYAHPLEEPYPGLETLRIYKSLGGNILTFGSDSHSSETVGRFILRAHALARSAGFTEYAVFANREPRYVELTTESTEKNNIDAKSAK